MTSVVNVSVKWSGKKFDDIPLSLDDTGSTFKMQLFSLTGVEPERQKIMIKGGMLKDDTDLKALNIKEGHTFMMMGTASGEGLKEPAQKTQFLEDMSESEVNVVRAVPPGLTNLGNTCYMNATLQCLRAIPELTEELKKSTASINADTSNNVVVSMRDLFKLFETSGQAIPPMVFLQTLRAAFPQFAQQDRGHFSQQDAEECYTSLVSTLDRKLVPSASAGGKSFVGRYMTGTMLTTMKCDEAPDEVPTVNEEPFVRLTCHISQNVNFLNQGLKEAMTERIEKNSPTLGRTANYTKSAAISRLPKFLTVGFVRFFWKQEQQVKAKIMRAVKFPFDLDMFEFCSQDLKDKMVPFRDVLKQQEAAREEQKKRRKLEGKDGNGSTSEVAEVPKKESIKDKVDASLMNDDSGNPTAMYELMAVLTHVGRTADAGHYMAWVRHQENADEWWKFDDDNVTAVKAEDIAKLYGGGDWHMAYMLLYRAKKVD